MTIFKKIIDKEIPADIIYEDELCLAFKDIQPQAPHHILVIPKKEIKSLDHISDSDKELLGHMLLKLSQIAKKLKINEDGYRTIINTNEYGGQTVYHLHMHLIGGTKLDSSFN